MKLSLDYTLPVTRCITSQKETVALRVSFVSCSSAQCRTSEHHVPRAPLIDYMFVFTHRSQRDHEVPIGLKAKENGNREFVPSLTFGSVVVSKLHVGCHTFCRIVPALN